MVRIQSSDEDRLRYREYKRSEFKPSNEPYQYQPYKPSFVGIYGEKQRERPTITKPDKPPPKPRTVKPRTTFESYSRPLGPDIQINDMGPAYKESNYEYKEYKPKPVEPYKPRPITPKDHFKSKPMHVDKRSGLYTNNVTYKLDEENNAALRNWNYGFVDDTVSAKRSKPKPKNKYNAPKAKKAEQKKKPVVAAAAPMRRSTPPPPPPPKPHTVSKSYRTSSTQHVGPGVKTTTTQTQASKTRTFDTQSEPDKTVPVPVVAPVPVQQSVKKVKTKSQGIQCSESPRKTVAKGTQFDSQKKTEFNTPIESTYASLQARNKSPEYAELAKKESPVYSRQTPPTFIPIVTTAPGKHTPPKQRTPTQTPAKTRWTPSPKAAKNNAHDNFKAISPLQPTPVRSAKPEVSSYPAVSKSGQSPFPYQTAQSPIQRIQTQTPAEARWTPSPEVAKTNDNLKAISPMRPTPVRSAKPEVSSYSVVSKSGRNPFPYQTTQSRLPPEITACIEAYDVAHGPV